MAGVGRLRGELSVAYDSITRPLLVRAIKASRYRGNVKVWIASPSAEFRHRDKGGLTWHEREFKRSLYFPIWREPINAGEPQAWSLAVDLIDAKRARSRRGVMARQFRITVRPKSEGRVRRSSESWMDRPELRNLGEQAS